MGEGGHLTRSPPHRSVINCQWMRLSCCHTPILPQNTILYIAIFVSLHISKDISTRITTSKYVNENMAIYLDRRDYFKQVIVEADFPSVWRPISQDVRSQEPFDATFGLLNSPDFWREGTLTTWISPILKMTERISGRFLFVYKFHRIYYKFMFLRLRIYIYIYKKIYIYIY